MPVRIVSARPRRWTSLGWRAVVAASLRDGVGAAGGGGFGFFWLPPPEKPSTRGTGQKIARIRCIVATLQLFLDIGKCKNSGLAAALPPDPLVAERQVGEGGPHITRESVDEQAVSEDEFVRRIPKLVQRRQTIDRPEEAEIIWCAHHPSVSEEQTQILRPRGVVIQVEFTDLFDRCHGHVIR